MAYYITANWRVIGYNNGKVIEIIYCTDEEDATAMMKEKNKEQRELEPKDRIFYRHEQHWC